MTKINLKNSCVLITGGTGSFGRTVVNSLLSQGVGEIRVFSRDEQKQHEMRNNENGELIKFIIGVCAG